jgi:hypothetical protein
MSSKTSMKNSTTTGYATMLSQDPPSPAPTLASSGGIHMSDTGPTALDATEKSIDDSNDAPTSQSECGPTVLLDI